MEYIGKLQKLKFIYSKIYDQITNYEM